MANINLLPWREELRQKRQRDFAIVVATALALTGLIVGGWYSFNTGLIENQTARNAYLDKEIKILDSKIKEIKDIEKDKENLIARMEVIQRLQTSRPLIVHLFDELIKVLPDGVMIDSMKQTDDSIIVEGYAQSNARVSALMRNIEQSQWLGDERLVGIDFIDTKNKSANRKNIDDKIGRAAFTLTFKQSAPKVDEEDEL